MRIVEVVADVWKILAGDAEETGSVHGADGEDKDLHSIFVLAVHGARVEKEPAVQPALDRLHALEGAHLQRELLDHRTQIGEVLLSLRLLLIGNLQRDA